MRRSVGPGTGTSLTRRRARAVVKAREVLPPDLADQAESNKDGCGIGSQTLLAVPLQSAGGVDQPEGANSQVEMPDGLPRIPVLPFLGAWLPTQLLQTNLLRKPQESSVH
ncbi:hypothetical protein V5E97_24000 [Singulisphaera sp. Ch08]|uniref:Uncharacterized protein n=1 Tax=Singulisphaera sp. Ch08 TaxID=3120278 RepID=A0AAU7C857_9BACT